MYYSICLSEVISRKFKEFQRKLVAKFYCELSYDKDNVSNLEFIVDEDAIIKVNNSGVSYMVCFNEAIGAAKCNCQLFEFRGILYRHILVVLIHKRISMFLYNKF